MSKGAIKRSLYRAGEYAFHHNRLMRRLIILGRNKRSHRFPPVVIVEETNRCNLRCQMCPRPSMNRPVGDMDFGLFQRIADECAHNKVEVLALHLFGEPLLHSKLPEMVRYAKAVGVGNVHLSTNATELKGKLAEELLDSELDSMIISFDGASPQTYNKLRQGAHFEEVKGNILNFIERKKERRKVLPRITLQSICMEETEAELEEYCRFWSGKADEVYIAPFDTFAGMVHNPTSRSPFFRRYPCPLLWRNLVVYWTGEVTICCRDLDGKGVVGDLRRQGLSDIWHGEGMASIRRLHKERIWGEFCRPCREWSWYIF